MYSLSMLSVQSLGGIIAFRMSIDKIKGGVPYVLGVMG